MNPASSPLDPAEAPLFADGLGERVVSADTTTGELLQILRLRPALTAVPSFEFALRERTARLANFRHAYYARVRRIDRVPATNTLAIVSDHVEGTRLSEILRVAQARGLQLDTNAALCLIRQLVPAVALLHENARDASHGLIAPERLVVTPHARLVIVEHVAGSAIEQLQFGRERLWQEFRVAMPSSAGVARFDHRADVSGIGMTALSLVLGRPLAADEFPHAIPGLLMQARERTPYGDERPLSTSFRNWLARALQLDVRRSYASATEALAGLEETLASDSAYVPAPVALEAFLTQYLSAMLDTPPAPPAVAAAPRPVAAPAPASDLYRAPAGATATRSDAGPALRAVESSNAGGASGARTPAARGETPAPAAVTMTTPRADPQPAGAPRDPASTFSVNDLPTIADLIKVGDLQKTIPVAPSNESAQHGRAVPNAQPLAPAPQGRPPQPAPSPPVAQPAHGSQPAHIAPPVHAAPPAHPVQGAHAVQSTPASPATRAAQAGQPAQLPPPARAAQPVQDVPAPAAPLSKPASRAAFEGMDEVIGGGDRKLSSADEHGEVASPLRRPRSRSSSRFAAIAAVIVLLVGGGATAWYLKGQAAPAPGLGTLSVQSSPAGVEVFVDGVSRGMTPAKISVEAGSHILELRGRGVPRVIPLQVPAGGQVSQYLEFADTPMTGMLVVHSQPAGANVSVDGVPRGVAPLTLDGLSPGDHEVTLQSDTGSSKHTVKVLAGTTASLVAPVTPAAEGPVSGWLSVKAPFTIEIREGGQLVGTSESDRLMMAAGRHEVELVNSTLGYREARVFQIVAGKVLPFSVVLPKGTVNLNAAPWAEVWIDGARVGDTPIGNLEVPIGPHEVVFRHPQFGEQRHAISVTAGAPVRLSVTMK